VIALPRLRTPRELEEVVADQAAGFRFGPLQGWADKIGNGAILYRRTGLRSRHCAPRRKVAKCCT